MRNVTIYTPEDEKSIQTL